MKEKHKIAAWLAVGIVIGIAVFGCVVISRNSIKTMELNAVNRGAKMVVGSIFQQLNQNGEVLIRDETSQIVLIPKVPYDPNTN